MSNRHKARWAYLAGTGSKMSSRPERIVKERSGAMQSLATNNASLRLSAPRPRRITVVGVVAIVFGVATVASGGFAIFGGAPARTALGQIVPFIVWFNFLAGFAYVLAGIGLLKQVRWSAWLSAAIAAVTLRAFFDLGVHILQGGAYEMRTVGAMTLRSLIWIAIAVIAVHALDRPQQRMKARAQGDAR